MLENWRQCIIVYHLWQRSVLRLCLSDAFVIILLWWCCSSFEQYLAITGLTHKWKESLYKAQWLDWRGSCTFFQCSWCPAINRAQNMDTGPCIWRWRYLIPLDNLGMNQRETEPADTCSHCRAQECPRLYPLLWALDPDRAAHMGKAAGVGKHPGRNLILHSKCAHSSSHLGNYTLGLISWLLEPGVWISHRVVGVCQ